MNLFSTTIKRPARRTNLDEESAAEVLLSKDVPTIPPPTDRELLTLWLEHKDTSALEAIIRRHGPLVRSLSSRLLRSHHEQADAFQTVFLVVSQNASRIRHRESLASWIYGVTVRTCLMFSRQRSRHDPIPEETEAPSFPRQEVLEHQELVLTLNKELDLLPSHLRESLVLVYLEGYSRQAAADLTNTTEQTIKSRLARGRNLLRTRLLKRGVTFSTAFTLFSVTTTADADTMTIPDLLLNKTLDTCQTGQLPLTFPSVPLDPIAIVPTGVPLMSSTTFYGTLAVATLLLLTTLGMGNRGHADGQQTVTSAIDTSINEPIPEIDELTPNVILEQQSATTTPAPATPAAEPVQQTSLTEKQTRDNPPSSSPVHTMELSLLDREIELFKAAEKGYRDTIKKFESMSIDQLIEFYKGKGVEPEQGRKSYLEFSNHRLALCTDHLAELEDRRQKLIDASKNYSAVAIDLIAEEAKLRLQLDAALAEYEQLLDRRLRIVGYHVPKKDILGNLPGEHLVPHIDEKTAELKIEMPELQAKIIDLTQQHAQVKAKLDAPVGSAMRTVNPPTTPIAPPAVADVDLSVGTANPRSMELQLLEIEIEMLKGSIESAVAMMKNARENPKYLVETLNFWGPPDLANTSHEERLKQFLLIEEPRLEASQKQLDEAQQRRVELLAHTAPDSEDRSLAEIEVRRLDSLIAQKKELYERMLLADLYSRRGALPADVAIDNRITSLDPEKIDELKFEILKLAIEKQRAEQALQSMQTASPSPSLPAPVGSAVRTVNPPTPPIAPPAVADVDLSPNPINPQPTPNLPPLKQSEQSLLDLKVERAELQLNSMQRLQESNPALVSRNDLQLKLLDAKIALQEALLERERFRAEQEPDSPTSELLASPIPTPAEPIPLHDVNSKPANSVTPPITTPKTLGVKFSNDFNAKLTFDKLTLPEPDTGAVQPIPAGIHPVTLTYKSSDNDQTFSQPLILEVLPEINELDMGELSGDFQLTLDNLALMQKGLFGQALVAYDRPNNRITASGRVGSGALVSQINTIVDLEAIRAGAKDFNSNLRTFGRDPQQRGHIVAILYSPDYDKNVKFRHEYYSPRSSRRIPRGSGPTEWSLLTPDGIPAIGTAVELFYVNADASSIEDLRIESADPDAPVTQKFKIAEVTANEIYLSPMDQSRTSLQPLSRSFFFQQAKEKYLILVPKDKYTPESLSTEIWNKLHPPAKD
ncbi:sigma-70 family RNA polymerase sigma factor [Lacunimicrobium album]